MCDFSGLSRPFHTVTATNLFNWDNMAMAGRYYEGGRATKRLKTNDGMTTVNNEC